MKARKFSISFISTVFQNNLLLHVIQVSIHFRKLKLENKRKKAAELGKQCNEKTEF